MEASIASSIWRFRASRAGRPTRCSRQENLGSPRCAIPRPAPAISERPEAPRRSGTGGTCRTAWMRRGLPRLHRAAPATSSGIRRRRGCSSLRNPGESQLPAFDQLRRGLPPLAILGRVHVGADDQLGGERSRPQAAVYPAVGARRGRAAAGGLATTWAVGRPSSTWGTTLIGYAPGRALGSA